MNTLCELPPSEAGHDSLKKRAQGTHQILDSLSIRLPSGALIELVGLPTFRDRMIPRRMTRLSPGKPSELRERSHASL